GWREGAGLRVGTPALRVEGEGYAASVRGAIWFQNDGSRPALDLAATVDDARVPVAKRFWVRHRMSATMRRWLDEALVDGQVRNGRALVSGDLDDWPFSSLHDNQHAGLFHAGARLQGAVVKFQPDWPALEQLDAEVAFVNDGFTLRGRGSLGGVEMRELEAGLAHYGRATLEVNARPRGDPGWRRRSTASRRAGRWPRRSRCRCRSAARAADRRLPARSTWPGWRWPTRAGKSASRMCADRRATTSTASRTRA